MAKYFWNHKNFFCLRAVSNKTLLRNGAWHFSKSHENLTPQKFWSYIHSNTAVIFCIKGWKFRKLVQLPPCFLQYEQCLAQKELAFGMMVKKSRNVMYLWARVKFSQIPFTLTCSKKWRERLMYLASVSKVPPTLVFPTLSELHMIRTSSWTRGSPTLYYL